MKSRVTAKEFREQFGGKPAKSDFVAEPARPKAQIRIPKPKQPNGTEDAWVRICEDYLRTQGIPSRVLFSPFILILPSGCRYTPDVVTIHESGQILAIYEVKGEHIHNDRSVHAFKEAKAAFPFWRFVFTQKTKAGWAQSE